ncbi:sensor histidine kinase [Fluviicola taffensis]|uniref:histidine kinase n=1 Tax=Fluviicola taffensis (strain DSM 16823 / NCIMB 13979 / RW262) TaxID=755732 RepID=F2IEG6_FLUTR|nr:ATP-binding protein [Fluviicola taffensis]AEA43490.1 integral membrane sensor signal transduction histidine kinase [Fluviicola taffensis DSM 16823]
MFKRVIQFLARRGYVLILSACCLLLIGLFFKVKEDQPRNLKKFQTVFLSQIQLANKQLNDLSSDWKSLNKSDFSRKYTNLDNTLFVHVYQSDSLIYWNTNKCPINRFADLHFPVNGAVQLQNGWYYSVLRKVNKMTYVVTFGIKRVFPIQNDQLKNYFFHPFPAISGTISLVSTENESIYDENGDSVFSITNEDSLEDNQSILGVIFLDLLIIFFLIGYKIASGVRKSKFQLLFILAVVFVRVAALKLDWFYWMEDTDLFDPGLMALNSWIPNLGEMLVWFFCLLLIFPVLLKFLSEKSSSFLTVVLLTMIPVWIMIYPQLIKLIIVNSTIPIHLSEVLKLNVFSIVFILVIAISSLFLIQLFLLTFHKWKIQAPSKLKQIGILTILLSAVIIANEWIFRLHGFWIIWMFLFVFTTFFIVFYRESKWNFTLYLLAIFLISFGITMNLEMEAKKKEREERLLFANQLADDRDINAEVDFTKAKAKLIAEPFLKRLFDHTTKPSFSELKEAMEYQVFNGYWDRFDVDCYYYLQDSSGLRLNGMYMRQLKELIERHGVRSEIDTSLYYVKDYTSQFNYVFYLPIERNGVKVDFFGTMKSKRIPEKIGFPRLLISKQTAVFESLERYSIAKYFNNQLVLNYGSYSYPTSLRIFGDDKSSGDHWYIKNGFEHLIFKKSKTDAIILSKPVTSWLSYLTTTSILLVSFGSIWALILFVRRMNQIRVANGVSMITKIQLVLISLIVVSLAGFSIASSTMLTGQYRSYSKDLIREKVKSVMNDINLRQRFTSEKFSEKNQEGLDYQLRRWSKVFLADINLYQSDGVLAGASRTKIYKLGLLSEQMNPAALLELQFNKKSEFIHEENIGSLVYLSGYVPVFDHENELLGYLNILHFDQRNAFEDQLKQFFVAILNVFMLLLVLSILTALLVSSWLTGPLMLLRKSFSEIEFGKSNAPINYKAQDEIGSLVAQYNHKLNELADAAARLAQSERESAWREMAKQVAHEIKNPLTPMKLSVQHLQRVFDPNDPKAAERIERVTNSLIEQIDALTSIANEFSNFAKLPQPIMTEVDILELLNAVAALFDGDGKIHVQVQLNTTEQLIIPADKEMILRVLNNLVSNGIQAASITSESHIGLSIDANEDFVFIRVRDNGTGIAEDQIQTIFEPYFTTKSTGTGLGLAMVKQIVETHHGSIEIENTSPEGTTVLVTLPRMED